MKECLEVGGRGEACKSAALFAHSATATAGVSSAACTGTSPRYMHDVHAPTLHNLTVVQCFGKVTVATLPQERLHGRRSSKCMKTLYKTTTFGANVLFYQRARVHRLSRRLAFWGGGHDLKPKTGEKCTLKSTFQKGLSSEPFFRKNLERFRKPAPKPSKGSPK